ncbi:MAG: hypothetical protein ACE5PV_04220 [Candidatus Poribacteria bacterium]
MSEELLELRKILIEDGFILDLDKIDTLSKLRRERNKIKEAMDVKQVGDFNNQRMMLWSGIPFPERQVSAANLNSQGRHLVVSVGGTNTYFMVMELKDGEIIAFENGNPRRGDEIEALQKSNRMLTPRSEGAEDSGREKMIHPIVEAIYPHLTHTAHQCQSIILNWGYSQIVKRDGAGFFDISTTTRMEKGQEGFSDLMGARVEDVFRDAIAEQIESELRKLAGFDGLNVFQMGAHLLSQGEINASAKDNEIKNRRELRKRHLESLLKDIFPKEKPKITVANDTIMALHYFLTGENLQTYDQIGLFVNGTGANFAIAENYLVDENGIPDRINRRPLEINRQNAKRFFVNYEVGVLELGGTKTIYDTEQTDQMERNALSGASFGKSFKEIVCRNLSTDVYKAIVSARDGKKIQVGENVPYRELAPEPEAIDIAQLSNYGFTSLEQKKMLLGEVELEPVVLKELIFIADAIIERSALHAALVLSAITRRTGYGLKEPDERKRFGLNTTKGDALCLEGSVWKIAGYREKTREFWQKLVGKELNVDFLHEPDYNASLYGPIYMAAAHAEKIAKMLL